MTGRTVTISSTKSADETRAVGRQLGRTLRPGDVVLLHGDLGAGKTTLTKGIADELGVVDVVQSPTYTVVAEYQAPALGRNCWLVHVDLYRLDGESATVGLDEVLDRDDAVVVIEWPERVAQIAQRAKLTVRIDQRGDDRTINVTGDRAVSIQ